jgi:glyoxylase-like metal-dependent hydrolase (beta-lactamase superfamily II)
MNRLIKTIDCQYIQPGFAASFLVHEGGEAYFVETNTMHAVPLLLEAMRDEGIQRDGVRWIAVTHVHLDHAGGAFALLDECPKATILAHLRAAKHLINPDKLLTSAKKVYGEEAFDRLYGDIQPVPADRVRILDDGEEILFQGSKLKCIYTRGHANHHFCLFDPILGGIFTGDSFGLAYPGLQRNGLFIFPSTSPTDFDPTAARETLDMILSCGANRAFLTHFGELRDLSAAREQLLEHLKFSENLYGEAKSGKEDFEVLRNRFEAELKNNFAELAKRAGLTLTSEDWQMVETDLRLNADGIAFAGIKARPEQPAWQIWLI